MIEVRELNRETFEAELAASGLSIPIEQTGAWMDLESTITDRSFWAHVGFVQDGEPLGWASFADYLTHGYHYLRSHHGPVWTHALTADEERAALKALVAFVRKRDRRQAFIRLLSIPLPEVTAAMTNFRTFTRQAFIRLLSISLPEVTAAMTNFRTFTPQAFIRLLSIPLVGKKRSKMRCK